MDIDTWDLIKKVYKIKFGIPARVVDLMAGEPIIRLCVEGRSNKYISKKLRLPQRYIRSVLMDCIRFVGWKQDLDISPIMVYDSVDGDWYYYKTTIKTVSSLTTPKEITLSYNLCRRYKTIRKEIVTYVK